MPSNREIGRLFNLYAELLLLHRSDERLAVLLSGAAFRLRRFEQEVLEFPKKQLVELFNPRVVEVFEELKKSDTIEALDELIQLTPSGLFEMMRIKGLGGKKLAILWHVAKIDTIEQLLEACKKDELSKIPGFGKKTEQNIIQAIENYQSHKTRFHYGFVADQGEAIVKALQQSWKTKLVSLCGEIRRQSLTVDGIDIIAAIDQKKASTTVLRKFMTIASSDKQIITGATFDEIPVIIKLATREKFYDELFRLTGNDMHVKKVLARVKNKSNAGSEEEIYRSAGIPYVLPELREDVAEWTNKNLAEKLVNAEDIKGVVHNHTTWSDGVEKLPDFVNACIKRKYEYVVIADHSKNAHYAGGMKEDKVLKQLKEIDKLNKKLFPFRVFKSIECDILVSGELDYGPDILGLFDLVIVSVHQLLKMDEERATKRLIRAIENPYTTILGHMTGRQLLIRPGYPVKHKKVIDACAANNVVIELNCNPYRMDLDWSHIPYALKKGVMISINPDAHSIHEIDYIKWGVAAARKGGLTKEMTWNAMGAKEVEKWLRANSEWSAGSCG
jgi:DNA polymerase (family X)